ncbi:MAG: hypothetical protein FWG07_06050 [Treponema sp.]|nr:hypothetical protein [Treponema sp.]
MKKKWTTLIIAAMVFVLLMVLGGCTITQVSPEEVEASKEKARLDKEEYEKTGGYLVIHNTGTTNHYWVAQPLSSPSNVAWTTAFNYPPGKKDPPRKYSGEYEVRYAINQTDQKSSVASQRFLKTDTQSWYRKTGYVGPGQTVTVTIP